MSGYAEQFLDKLKSEADKRGLSFLPDPPSELAWTIEALRVRPNSRSWYGLEGHTAMTLGIIFVPNPGRKHGNTAWNRIEELERIRLSELEVSGWKDRRISFTFIQIWEEERRTVLLPLKTLQKLSTFTTTGDFTVKKDGAMFHLVTPRGEDNIPLNTSLSDLFRPLLS